MVEAAQPAPPSVTEFLTVWRGVIDPQTATGASTKLFGQMFKDNALAAKPKGLVGVHKFETVRHAMGETSDSLDAWFSHLAYFTL